MTEASVPRDKADLLARIASAWKVLIATVEPLTTEQTNAQGAGAWSVKDNLAHLAEWEQLLVGYHIKGEPPYAVIGIDETTFVKVDDQGIDAVNDLLYRRDKDRPAQDILDALKRSHAQVLQALQSIAWEDLMKPSHPEDQEQRPLLLEVIGNTYDHYAEHQAAIEKIIGQTTPGKK